MARIRSRLDATMHRNALQWRAQAYMLRHGAPAVSRRRPEHAGDCAPTINTSVPNPVDSFKPVYSVGMQKQTGALRRGNSMYDC